MLAQSFVSAAELGITEPQRDALQKVLVLLETGKLVHAPEAADKYYPSHGEFTGHFNMAHWNSAVHDCGTVACIGGTAEMISEENFMEAAQIAQGVGGNEGLYQLFMPFSVPDALWPKITSAQAARALRSYLTTGDAKWAEAVE